MKISLFGNRGDFPFRWRYRSTLTQDGAGGGNATLRVQIPENMLLMVASILLGPDDYAAGRTLRINILDQEGTPNSVSRWASLSIDNQLLIIPSTEDLAADSVQDTTSQVGRTLFPQDQLECAALSLAQNETFDVCIRAFSNTIEKPTIDTSASGGTVSVSTTYNTMK